MSTLYILCGLQFSGKSYISKQIQKQCKASIISFDEIYDTQINEFNKQKMPESKRWFTVKKIAITRLREELKIKSHIVWDSTNPKKIYREELKQLASKEGVTSKLIFVNIPIEVIKTRIKKNDLSPARHKISTADLINTINEMEEPLDEEEPFVYNYGDDVEFFTHNLISSNDSVSA